MQNDLMCSTVEHYICRQNVAYSRSYQYWITQIFVDTTCFVCSIYEMNHSDHSCGLEICAKIESMEMYEGMRYGEELIPEI